MYRHRIRGDAAGLSPPGKAVCVGRNYAEHARELNNPVPDTPLLFIKPATAMVAMEDALCLPEDTGECHHELELALLIGRSLRRACPEEAVAAVAGYGLALDLTLRELQLALKAKGHPWERAKAFDGACPLSVFVPAIELASWRDLELKLWRNGQLQQSGQCRDMLFPIDTLLADISHCFTLLPGDVVLTGTPPGVGPLRSGDVLRAELGTLLRVDTQVV